MKKYDAVCQINSERHLQLERAQSLVSQFWETYEELWPWLTETQRIISQLPAPALEYETLRRQQEEHRVRTGGPFPGKVVSSGVSEVLPHALQKPGVSVAMLWCVWSTLPHSWVPATRCTHDPHTNLLRTVYTAALLGRKGAPFYSRASDMSF